MFNWLSNKSATTGTRPSRGNSSSESMPDLRAGPVLGLEDPFAASFTQLQPSAPSTPLWRQAPPARRIPSLQTSISPASLGIGPSLAPTSSEPPFSHHERDCSTALGQTEPPSTGAAPPGSVHGANRLGGMPPLSAGAPALTDPQPDLPNNPTYIPRPSRFGAWPRDPTPPHMAPFFGLDAEEFLAATLRRCSNLKPKDLDLACKIEGLVLQVLDLGEDFEKLVEDVERAQRGLAEDGPEGPEVYARSVEVLGWELGEKARSVEELRGELEVCCEEMG